jgi:hypothetical protein
MSAVAAGGGWLLVAAWAGGVVVLFAVWQPLWQPFAVLLGVTAIFLGWWFRQKPSHERDWVPSSAVLPRAVGDGDAITIETSATSSIGRWKISPRGMKPERITWRI